MIDNIILLITGTLHERDTSELVQRCHPLGMYDMAGVIGGCLTEWRRFDAIGTLSVCSNVSDLYSTVLVDTPLAPYFESCMSEEDLNEVNIEIIRNKLWKVMQRHSHLLY